MMVKKQLFMTLLTTYLGSLARTLVSCMQMKDLEYMVEKNLTIKLIK